MSNKLYTQFGARAKRALEHRPSTDENGEEYGASSFGGLGDYMRRKKLKLQNQDEELRKDITDEPQIFKGMVVHVQSSLKVINIDQRVYKAAEGGPASFDRQARWRYLEGKTGVTHIIASNLTPKKREEFKRYKVVRPEWIVDSVKAGKALPWNRYRLIESASQMTLLTTNKFEDSYRSVSSREEFIFYGGGGLQQQQEEPEVKVSDHKPTQESSSYPTPPEMKSIELEETDEIVKSEFPVTTSSVKEDLMDDLPSTLSQIEISSPKREWDLSDQQLYESTAVPEVPKGGELNDFLMQDILEETSKSPANPTATDSPPRPFFSPVGNRSESRPASPLRTSSPALTTSNDQNPSEYVPPKEDAAAIAAKHNAAILANPSLRHSTVLNPDFIKSYFDQSRLHHLSTWKADLKNQMQQLTMQKPRRQAKRSGPRTIMHVDFDCFFASVSLISRPELKDKPVCVGHGGGKSGEIASCNYVARKYGVHNGMFMGSALELCKDLVCLPYDFPAYEKASRDFYETLLSVDADATQAVSVDEALLDVSTGWGDDPESVATSIRDKVREKTQCEVSIGIGANILLAKLALRKAKPAGQYHLKADEFPDFMQNLNVRDLPGVGWKLSEKLEEVMNVQTVGEVRNKSLSELKEKFGPKTGEKLYNFARGIDDSEVGEIVQRKSVSVEVNWGVRFETAEQVDKFLISLAAELSSRLIKESFVGRHMMLKVMRRAADAPLDPPKHLGHGLCDTFNKSVQLGVATNDAMILARETISMMKSLKIPPGELRGIGLQMGKLERVGETKLETGQRKLNFTKSVRIDEPPKFPKEVEQPAPLKDETPLPPPVQPTTPVKSTQFIAPTQIDPDVLANLPDDIRSRLLFRKPMEIQNSQIDQDVFKELPPSIQEELRQAYERPKIRSTPTKKKISPRKPKLGLLPGQSKLPLASAEELDASVLAELPSTIRQEVIDDNRREQALARAAKARHEAWLAEKAQRDRKVNRTITIPDPPPIPTFQKLSELSDLRNLISMWFKELCDEGPAEEDVELLGNYLRKVVLIEKDMRKAEAVVRWFLWCCRDAGPTMDEWYAAGQRLGDHVNEACTERGAGRINFDEDT